MARRVFFSFHYQDVVDFRANVPRNSWLTQKRDDAGFFDSSIWESSKKNGDEALKRLINDGLQNTSVTAVLIGSETYARPWVRYEIVQSIARGNRIIGIHINGILGKDGLKKSQGPNPFDFLAIVYSNDGTSVTMTEWSGNEWVRYSKRSAWTLNALASPALRGKAVKLSELYKTYDWVKDDGYTNLKTWVDG
jgi:hypothetical protein